MYQNVNKTPIFQKGKVMGKRSIGLISTGYALIFFGKLQSQNVFIQSGARSKTLLCSRRAITLYNLVFCAVENYKWRGM